MRKHRTRKSSYRGNDSVLPPPLRAGESHMGLGLLLPCSARRILKTTPELGRTSDGQIRKGISATAGPTCGQCKARTFGRAVCRAGCSVVWSGVVRGYGGLRTIEGRAVAARPSSGAWHPEPRYV